MTGPIDPEIVELAGRVFDLARGGHTEELTAYLDAGADPDAGERSARATAAFFELPEMAALLEARPR